MSKHPVSIRFGGLGGQGLVTLGVVLAEAGAASGLCVAASQSYGSRARGGTTRSDVILSNEEIDFPHVHHPDILVVLAKEAYELYLPDMQENSLVLADDFFVKIQKKKGVHQLAVAGTLTAVEVVKNRVAANFVMFGSVIAATGLVSKECVTAAMKELVNPRFAEVNLQAFEQGLELGKKLKLPKGLKWL